jgi:hypothetical protein
MARRRAALSSRVVVLIEDTFFVGAVRGDGDVVVVNLVIPEAIRLGVEYYYAVTPR